MVYILKRWEKISAMMEMSDKKVMVTVIILNF